MLQSIAHQETAIRLDPVAPSSATVAILLPAQGFVRQPTVLTLIPVGRSTLWEMIKRGEFPAPVKLSSRISAWRCEDVRAYIAGRSA